MQRHGDAPTAPFVFTGVQILDPRLFADAPDGEFSLNILCDRAQATRRLCGLVHDADWLHIGTPEILTAAESWFAARDDRVESFGVAVLPGDKGPSGNHPSDSGR